MTKLKKFLMGTTFVLYAVLLFFIAYFSYIIKKYEFFPLELYFFFGLTYVPIFFFLANSTIKKWHYIFAGLLIVLAFFSYPSTSADPFHYLFDGQLIRIFKLSPYLAIPTQFPVDQYLTVFKDAWWANYPSAYGPAWEFLMAIINFISGNTALIGIICLKIIGLIFLIISTKLIFKLNHNKSLAWLFLINPIVLTNAIGTPHPDIILLAFILLPFLNLNTIKSSLSLSVASLIKINSIIFVPFWIGREKIIKNYWLLLSA